MFSKIRTRLESEKGFTLIELLVVILIIGILAAIAIPSFLSQRVKGQDTCAKTQARTAQTAMETYYTDSGKYDANAAALAAIESQVADTASKACDNATAVVATSPDAGDDDYLIDSTSESDTVFSIKRTALGVVSRTCNVAGKGGCKAGGVW